MTVTSFENLVLLYLSETGRMPTGKGLVAFVAAGRRLEKKGLAGNGSIWYVTQAGRDYLAERKAIVLKEATQ